MWHEVVAALFSATSSPPHALHGGAAFGEIYHGRHVDTSREVAIKLEPVSTRHRQLPFEARIYKMLRGGGTAPLDGAHPPPHWEARLGISSDQWARAGRAALRGRGGPSVNGPVLTAHPPSPPALAQSECPTRTGPGSKGSTRCS